MRAVQATHFTLMQWSVIVLDAPSLPASNDGALVFRAFSFLHFEINLKFYFSGFLSGLLDQAPWTIDGSATASRHKVQGVELIPT